MNKTLFIFLFITSFIFCLNQGEGSEIQNEQPFSVESVFSEEDPSLPIAEIQSNGIITTYQYDNEGRCTALFRECEGRVLARCFYLYNSQGLMVKAQIDDGQATEAEDETGVTHQQIIEIDLGMEQPLLGKPLAMRNRMKDLPSDNGESRIVYEVIFNYDDEGTLVSSIDSLGQHLIRADLGGEGWAASSSNLPMGMDLISWDGIWNGFVDSFFYYFKKLQLSAHQAKSAWNVELKLTEPFAQMLDKFGQTLFGDSYWLMGPHHIETKVDSFGETEVGDKVRVTFINGILNTHSMIYDSLKEISLGHGGVKIHFVYRPTEGWTWDISRAVMIKAGFGMGFRSIHAYLLADLWKKLIEEMGGVEGGGVIVHYAHSLGGTETDRARDLLLPEEQKMIRVTTFGSATLIRNEGFQSVINHVSVHDGVSCNIFIEPIGHIRNYFDPNSNVRFHGSCMESKGGYFFPLDHTLDGVTYAPLLRECGEKFIEEFIKKK